MSETAVEYGRRTRAEQGFPPTVEDPAVLRRIALRLVEARTAQPTTKDAA